ncbi:MAG: hypothetical protein HYV28_09435 [Ignavibacteriales bacterium]|nr:hypothetical protein [Ignavibacteriales bacterium]
MKKRYLLIALFSLTLLFMFSACKKDDGVTSVTDIVSDDDIANHIAGIIGDNNTGYGFTHQAEYSASRKAAAAPEVPNKTGFDSVYTITKTGTYYTYTYKMWLSVTPGLLNVLNVDMYSSGNFETQKLTSKDTGASEIKVSSILGSAADYFITANYKRIGTTFLKRNSNLSFTSTSTMTFDSVLVDKDSLYLKKGKAALVFTYTVAGKTSTIDAQVTYLSNKSATLIFNGKTYTLDLTTATATKK